MSGWSLTASGWPWWLGAAVALVGVLLLWRWYPAGGLGRLEGRSLRVLRVTVFLITVIMLTEPSLVWQEVRETRPRVLALVDGSASMGTAGEVLPAGQVLDLVAVEADQNRPRDRQAVELAEALHEAMADDPSGRGFLTVIDAEQERIMLWPGIADGFTALRRVITSSEGGQAWRDQAQAVIDDLLQIQASADAAFLNSLDDHDPIRLLAETIRQRSRFERARQVIAGPLQSRIGQRLDLSIRRADHRLQAIEEDQPLVPRGETDIAGALAAVHSHERGRGWDAVLVFSDGRNTVPDDPAPFIKALEARGTHCHLIQVGSEAAPRDAVVAAIEAPDDVFRQEVVPVQVRYRVPAARGMAFALVVEVDDQERYRRRVAPSTEWRYTTVNLPMPQAGTVTVTAALVPIDDLPRPVPTSGMLEERWPALAMPADYLPVAPPGSRSWVDDLAPSDDRTGLRRVRATLRVPVDGVYRFDLTTGDRARSSIRHRSGWQSLMTIDDEALAEDGPARRRSPAVRLLADHDYPFELIHEHGGGPDVLALRWRREDAAAWTPVPASALHPPAPAAVPDLRRDNNSAVRTLVVHDEPLRVLLLDRLPRWDARSIRDLAAREGQIDLTTRYLVTERVLGASAAVFEDLDDLISHDAIIIGDLDPQQLRPSDQDLLARYVAGGGSLLVVAGRRAMPGAYHLGRMADLLPVAVEGAGVASGPVRCRLPEGADHPATRVLPDAQRNRRLWSSLPPLQWSVSGGVAKSGARVLLETEEGAPVIATQRYGAGRVIFIGTDETWRWRAGIGGALQQHLWLRLLRWGTGVPLRGRDPRLQVALERSLVHPGEQGVLRIRSDHSLGSHRPLVEAWMDDARSLLPVTFEHEGAGTWRAVADLPVEGRCHFVVRMASAEGGVLTEERQLVVREPAGRELIDLSADRAALQRLAALAGTRLQRLGDIDALAADLIRDLPPQEELVSQTWSLWDGSVVPIMLLLFLGLEWIWRRRRGLP